MKTGFVINPFAGIGGAVALKGSDGNNIVARALAKGAEPQAEKRALLAMQTMALNSALADDTQFYCAADNMGENVLQKLGLRYEVIWQNARQSSAADTKNAIRQFVEQRVDLIVFAGGDGTARDVLDVLVNELHSTIPVIGIPAGVKIHSAVYASTPVHAGELISLLASGEPLTLHESQVMDLDEDAFRQGRVNAKCYGYLSVPVDDTRMQLIKQGGLNYHEIAVQDIANEIIENMEPDTYYLIGSGSTTAEIMNLLALDGTLLGIDIVYNQQLVAKDVDEQTILKTIQHQPAKIVVTAIGGQGHIFGRGNQQLSSKVIRQVGRENIIIIASNEKLRSLDKRPMISDTGDSDLDRQLAGLYSVVTGYQQKTLYRLK
ncbi:MAG: ATP-NAD kinase family protein [Gammaproteobacteria bacterium]|nr:ATP-NAD kinase family protein [Gammaproteobacteria bacterium]